MNDKPMGTFHLLPPELQKTAIVASQENAKSNRKNFDEALERQFKKRRMKGEIMLRKQYANATEEYVVVIYFYEQYHSPRCWKSVEEAKSTYARLASEVARLVVVKEQILIWYLGLRWVQAHHAWLENRNTFIARRLLKHLEEVVIPLAEEFDVPLELPVNVPTIPEMKVWKQCQNWERMRRSFLMISFWN